MNLESVVPYVLIAVVGIFVYSRISGQPFWFRTRRPTGWDAVPVAFAFCMPVVGTVIPNGFVASAVVVLTGLALILVGRRYGQPRVEGSPEPR